MSSQTAAGVYIWARTELADCPLARCPVCAPKSGPAFPSASKEKRFARIFYRRRRKNGEEK